MRAVLTRVRSASVTIDGKVNGAIGRGYLVLLGVGHNDTEETALKLADKVCNLRIFRDENDKMNLNLEQVGGSILVISQFTLYGDARHGRRPSFIKAARPEQAIPLYEYAIRRLSQSVPVETGRFGAEMQVALVNDGPVTILLESKRLF